MLYEMRAYFFLPTALPKYLKHAEEVGRPVRGNDHGSILGIGRASSVTSIRFGTFGATTVMRNARNCVPSSLRTKIGQGNTLR